MPHHGHWITFAFGGVLFGGEIICGPKGAAAFCFSASVAAGRLTFGGSTTGGATA